MEKTESQSKTPKNDENQTYEKLIMFWYSVMGMEREDRATSKGSHVKSSPNLIRYNVMGDILTRWNLQGCHSYIGKPPKEWLNHYAYVCGFPVGSTPGPTVEICEGIQGDGWESLPELGREKLERLWRTSQIEASTSPRPRAPGQTPDIWRLFLPGREGIWSPLIKSGNLIASLDFMLLAMLIPRGLINHGGDDGDKLWWKKKKRLYIRGGVVENQRPTQAFFRIWKGLRAIDIHLWIISNWRRVIPFIEVNFFGRPGVFMHLFIHFAMRHMYVYK